MRLIFLTVVVAVIVGLMTGGSLRAFPSISIRLWWLAVAGIALQLLPGRGAIAVVFLFASFIVLLVFAVANARAAGFPLILAGLALNALVIGVNQGMPVSRGALSGSGQLGALDELAANGNGQKHFLAEGDTPFLFLGDVLAIPQPIGQAISVGDLLVHVGVGWFVVAAMHPRRREAVPEAGRAES